MKIKFYSILINITSFLLNECIKAEMWKFAKHLTEFRKTHLAVPMRKLI